jgi:hypothetical protein
MAFWLIKLVLSALVIVVISEVAKRSGWLGGLIGSLPIVSILTIIWVYLEQQRTDIIMDLSISILYFILPSLVLFLSLPILLKRGAPFWGALSVALTLTLVAYGLFFGVLQRLGIKL